MPIDLRTALLASVATFAAMAANAADFNIPGGDLKSALDSYSRQTGVSLLYSDQAIRGVRSQGVQGDIGADEALSRILTGTGFQIRRHEGSAITIVRGDTQSSENIANFQIAQAAPARSAVETVTVTSSKLGGADVQSIPIAITALSQEQLTASQTNGGPDLIKQVPNMSFTKTNFSGYSIQLRGIGTQAISVTTDPAVAVALNDMPFIRNHFFEQEFFDLGQVEVLRGPQGTLYGRNATAGVVNLTTAKPTDQFEGMASAELGNYHQRRFEGMVNLPIVDDRLDIRLAGEWTKRDGYSFNELTDKDIDGRDLWSGRLSIAFKPTSNFQATLVWEHFSEDDDRLRSGKQTCKTAPLPTQVGGVPVPDPSTIPGGGGNTFSPIPYLTQACLPASLYSKEAFGVPNGFSLPFYGPLSNLGTPVNPLIDPYARTVQSTDLRHIESSLEPVYKAKNDILQLNADYQVTPELTFTSQTGFNHDFLFSAEDYNRFNTAPGVFVWADPTDPMTFGINQRGQVQPDGTFCDPQLGCSDRLVAEDLVTEHSWQANQEFRLASHFSGPFNFSVGGNYMHYETEENYYVFINSITLFSVQPLIGSSTTPWVGGVSSNDECLVNGHQFFDPTKGYSVEKCRYIDPNPISSLDNEGHNYFLSQNPYLLNSYAGFGEVYYDVTPDLKLTGGARFTIDKKHFTLIPSWFTAAGYGYPVAGVVDQSWSEWTGRFAANWTPKLDFTDQTLFYGSYAHGYKAGGANPPPPIITDAVRPDQVTVSHFAHPLTFKPEFIDAFELGSKNTLLDGAMTLNGNVFYYNYENYQISQIVDRTSVNLNFDAHIKGVEMEATYEPLPGLRFNLSGGYEDARLAKGAKAIDLMDRTAGNSDWVIYKPFPTNPSNCIIPAYVVGGLLNHTTHFVGPGTSGWPCESLYVYGDIAQVDGKPDFDPATVPDINNGEGFYKDLSHNQMPNAPPFTLSAGAQYSLPITSDWAATLRGDFYWQSNSYWRVFNDLDYDKLRGYNTLNLTLILTNEDGWQVMVYDKNVFNTTAITGAFLNSDDSGLTTNVFLTDPRLIGVRVTKNW